MYISNTQSRDQILDLESNIWDKVLKKRPSKICRRQTLKIFAWCILEYFALFDLQMNIRSALYIRGKLKSSVFVTDGISDILS